MAVAPTRRVVRKGEESDLADALCARKRDPTLCPPRSDDLPRGTFGDSNPSSDPSHFDGGAAGPSTDGVSPPIARSRDTRGGARAIWRRRANSAAFVVTFIHSVGCRLMKSPGPAWPSPNAGDQPIATREASGRVMNVIADGVYALTGGSADLVPSTKTMGWKRYVGANGLAFRVSRFGASAPTEILRKARPDRAVDGERSCQSPPTMRCRRDK